MAQMEDALSRIVKPSADRHAETVGTAERLFREIDYASCSVEMIIREMGVAKGTFYYYFKSKPAILEAIVDRSLDQTVAFAEDVARAPSRSALQKIEAPLRNSHIGGDHSLDVAGMPHLPGNRELHELTNVQTVLRLSPILAGIVEQGIAERVFEVERPLETIRFLFTGVQVLTDGGMFGFSQEQLRVRRLAMQTLIERSRGAAPGSFQFMNPAQGAAHEA